MKKWTRILAITLGCALVFSAIGAGVVLAADPPAPTTTPPSNNYGQLFLDKLSARLGISADKYTAAVKGARQDVIDQQVKDGRLTTDQAKQIKDRLDTATANGFGIGGPMMGARGGMRGSFGTGTTPGGRFGANGVGPLADCPCS